MGIHDYEKRLEGASEILAKSTIREEDKKLIRHFVERKVSEGVGVPRQEKYLRMLRQVAERYFEENHSFSSLKEEDVISVIGKIESTSLSDWTKYDFKLVLKIFLVWLGKEETIKWMKIKEPKTLPNDLLNEQEVMALIDAAESLRDKALIAALYEGGFRIGELGGLRIKDVSFDRYGAIAMVNGKTGPRPVRLIWSMPYIAQWLEAHPLREEQDAPLWIKTNTREMLKYNAIRMQLRKIARRAGIEKPVNPHSFRHLRITELKRKRHLSRAQIEQYFGWIKGSRMHSIYDHLSGQDLDADLVRMYGMEPEKEDQQEELKTLQCPHCKTLNTIGARICINCRKPLAVEEVMEREESTMAMFKDFMDLVTEHPEVIEKFKKLLGSKREAKVT